MKKAVRTDNVNRVFDNKKIITADNYYVGAGGKDIEYRHVDRQFARTVRLLLIEHSGGPNRARIMEFLNSKPANARAIARCLGLNYKTVRHHLKILLENGLVVTTPEVTYGANYFLSPLMENHYELFADQWRSPSPPPSRAECQDPFLSQA